MALLCVSSKKFQENAFHFILDLIKTVLTPPFHCTSCIGKGMFCFQPEFIQGGDIYYLNKILGKLTCVREIGWLESQLLEDSIEDFKNYDLVKSSEQMPPKLHSTITQVISHYFASILLKIRILC